MPRLIDLSYVVDIFVLSATPDCSSPGATWVLGRTGAPANPAYPFDRARELAALAALPEDADVRLVTLTGPGGVGKSRLALRLATDLASTNRFNGGVDFVELAAVRDPDHVLPAIAQTLGVRGSGQEPVETALTGFLRARELLLVLDNFEQVSGAAPRVTDLLRACPRLTVIVTSRSVLNLSGEQVVPVAPLSLPSRHTQEEFRVSEAVREYLEHLTRHAKNSDLFSVISLRTGPGRSEAIPRGTPVCQAGGCFTGGPAEGGGASAQSRLWKDEAAQDAWVDLWKATAQRFKNNPLVIGYHLLAMPDAPDVRTYRAFLRRLVGTIREVDGETPILISAPGEGLPEDLDGFDPNVDDDKTIYRVVTFAPERYLRQSGDAGDPLTYGEAFDEEEDDTDGHLDRDWLEESLEPAKEWAKANKRPVAIGGYGIPRWEAGLDDYLDDLLDLVEDAEWVATLWHWYPEQGPTGEDAFNLEYGANSDNHRGRDNPLLDVVEQHWRDVEIRPSNFS